MNIRNLITAYPVIFSLLIVAGGCATAGKGSSVKNAPSFYKIGHRGTRGLMPENTIPAMEKGIAAGANTIEFDVHITKDGKVVVYHDASFNPAYTLMPDGAEIPASERKKYTFYQMDYADIRQFIIGKKYYPQFPEQELVPTYAPLLTEMIDSIEAFTRAHQYAPVYYLLEIKSSERTDGREQPAPEAYVDILMKTLKSEKLGDRLIIQSFDMRPLQVIHREYPGIRLGFLTGDKKVTFGENMRRLGFTPEFYNPEYHLVTRELLEKCHAQKMKVCPWTVETKEEMKRLKAMGVDGIITDYPDRLDDL